MAAGGSAPELFTALTGTFEESAVGFGTVVGSAVFNVMFVIGVCAVASDKPLDLTWWPLARDCSYYAGSLYVLSIFMADQKIWWWEAFILLGMYLGYVTVMAFNMKLHRFVLERVLRMDTVSIELAMAEVRARAGARIGRRVRVRGAKRRYFYAQCSCCMSNCRF